VQTVIVMEELYPVLDSQANSRDAQFQENRESNLATLEELGKILKTARDGGGEVYCSRHLKKGKLLARERIELLLDPDSHFLELSPIAGYNIPNHTPGSSIVGGLGIVSGIECMIVASDPTVKGGAVNEYGVIKGARLSEISRENRLPVIHLTESAGADLPNQSKIFVPGGATFKDITRSSKSGVPTVCLVFGS